MAIRKIIQDTDPVIRKVSKPVVKFDGNLWELLDDMKETMQKADGVGLAAVQVGVLKRVFIVEINNLFFECINPQIVSKKGEQLNEEGCLSIAYCTGMVKRPLELTVTAFDRYGHEFTITATDYLAVALNHEYDHLDGVLFTDKAEQIFKKQ
jgi:peptide deformylase